MANISVASLPCFSLDEKILHILWDEGVQMEELLDFSFERVGKLADERGVQLDDAHKEELWLYVQRMKAEQPDWVSLSHYQDRSSQQQQFDSCLDNFTEVSRFHTAQLSWDPCQSWEEPRQASFSRDSLEITALPCEEKGDADERDVKPKSSKRMCKTPKTFRLSKCDLSPISPKPRATVRRSHSKVAALLRRLVHEKTTNEPVEDHFFTRGIWPSWLNFSATPKLNFLEKPDMLPMAREPSWFLLSQLNLVLRQKGEVVQRSPDVRKHHYSCVGSDASVRTDTGCRLRARDVESFDSRPCVRTIQSVYS